MAFKIYWRPVVVTEQLDGDPEVILAGLKKLGYPGEGQWILDSSADIPLAKLASASMFRKEEWIFDSLCKAIRLHEQIIIEAIKSY